MGQLHFVRLQEREKMSVQLLDKTRKINKLLHNNNSSKVVFNDICRVLSDILDSNVPVFFLQKKMSICRLWGLIRKISANTMRL